MKAASEGGRPRNADTTSSHISTKKSIVRCVYAHVESNEHVGVTRAIEDSRQSMASPYVCRKSSGRGITDRIGARDVDHVQRVDRSLAAIHKIFARIETRLFAPLRRNRRLELIIPR